MYDEDEIYIIIIIIKSTKSYGKRDIFVFNVNSYTLRNLISNSLLRTNYRFRILYFMLYLSMCSINLFFMLYRSTAK